MLGIIMKDYYESFRIRKNLVGMLLGFGSLALMLIFMDTFYAHVLTVSIIFPMLGCSPLQYSLEQDEISKFDDILLTYPITKKELVLSQFTACLSFTGIMELAALGLTFVYVCIHHTTDFKTGLLIWAAGAIFSIAFLSISNIGFFALGNKKGTIIYIALVIIFSFSYVLAYWNIDFMAIFQLDIKLLLPLAFIVSLLLLVGSYYLCLKIYTKKHS